MSINLIVMSAHDLVKSPLVQPSRVHNTCFACYLSSKSDINVTYTFFQGVALQARSSLSNFQNIRELGVLTAW